VRASPRAVVVLGIAIAACLHAAAILHKTCWDHDETISYLAATGNQERYERALADSSFVGAWTPASRWKAFFSIDRPFAFARIGGDLARHDVHPPLYFWLLHVWVLLAGVNVWAGPLLNVFITAATGYVLFRLARHVSGSPEVASVVLFLWLVSPIYRVAGEARQYQLLAFWSALLYWQALHLRFATRVRVGPASVAAGAIVACGFLTHYHFAIPLAACALLLAAPRARARPLAALGIGALAGATVFLLLHPHFLDAFRTVVPSERPLTLSDFRYRVTHIPIAFAAFAIEPHTAVWLLRRPATLVALASAGAIAAFALARLAPNRASLPAPMPAPTPTPTRTRLDPRGDAAADASATDGERFRAVATLLGAVFGGFAILYLLQITPKHAMGARYLSPLWPLLCIAVVMVVSRWARFASFALRVLAIGLVVSSAVGSWLGSPSDFPLARWLEPPPAALVSDTAARGVFPRVFMLLRDDCAVLVASQESLLRRGDAQTIAEAVGRDGVYVSSLRHSGTEAGRDAVVARLSARCAPERSEEFDGLGTIFRWRCR